MHNVIKEFAHNPEPRVPCILLLDTSGSMVGEPVAELWCGCGDDQGLCPLHAALLARS